MGSAVENVENASFVDRIRWSKKTYTLRMLLEFRQPPCIVHILEGHRGNNDVENLPPGLIVRINSVFAERRIFARCADGRVFSIPETFPIKFEVIKKNRKRSKAKRLDEILRNYRPPIVVALDRRNNKWSFRNGKTIQSEDSLGTMVLMKAYFEHFARVNQLIDGAIDRRVFLIPLYLDLDVRLAEGLRNENTSDFSNLMNMYSKAIGSIDYSAYTGLNAILEFDPSAGSVHPLAASRLPSMDNSIRGVSESRTVTDVPTTGVKGSLASGSQGRPRGMGRSEDPQQRKRAQSEDFLGAMTSGRDGGRRLSVHSETRAIDISSDDSISGGSSAEEEELELLKETTAARSSTLSRTRRGRSVDELQERRRTTRSRATPEVASLDRLPLEVSQATAARIIARRPETQNVRPAKENHLHQHHQTGGGGGATSSSTGRVKTTGRQEGHSREDETIVSNRSRSRNPVAVHPMPKPRPEKSRRQSAENSAVSVPPVGVSAGKNSERVRGESTDGPVALNRSQGWSASPAPNYHIHINIQSPNSPPTQQQQQLLPILTSSLDGHSTMHRTPATAGHPVRPFPDSSHLEDRPVWQPFARQDSRPDLLPQPQPVRHARTRQEPRKPKEHETIRPPVHLRQESYPPRSVESGRHAFIMHAAVPPPKILSEPPRPVYIRQETYPRENFGWNGNSPNKRFFRDFVPTMFKRQPSDRRSTSGRIFVSSVSCTGSDSLVGHHGNNNSVNEGHRSHGLRSKVIRLKNGEESEIAEMEVKEFYGRTSTVRSTGNYVKPLHVAVNGDVNNNKNFSPSSGEYDYPTWSSVFDHERTNPRSTKRAATKIEILDSTLATKSKFQDRSIGVGGGFDGERGRNAHGSRHWILRSGMQKPDNRSAALRPSLGTTIAV